MSRNWSRALEYRPEDGHIAQTLLEEGDVLQEDDMLDVMPLNPMPHAVCLYATDDIEQATITADQNFTIAYFAGVFGGTTALKRLRPRATSVRTMGGQEVKFAPPVARWSSPLSRIIREVSRLPIGWAGEGSVGPSDDTVRAMQSLAGLLPNGAREPSAEIDPEDGAVSLTWTKPDMRESFTLTVFGSGKIGGSHAALDNTSLPAWIVPVEDYRKISAHLNSRRLLAIICG